VDPTPLVRLEEPRLRLEFRDYGWAEEAGREECGKCVKKTSCSGSSAPSLPLSISLIG